MKRKPLTTEELNEALQSLPGWQIKNGKLHKVFVFSSFSRAIGWMVSTAVEADKLDHHPEWTNVYNRVIVNLVTHDLGNQISTWDIHLAQIMDKLAEQPL